MCRAHFLSHYALLLGFQPYLSTKGSQADQRAPDTIGASLCVRRLTLLNNIALKVPHKDLKNSAYFVMKLG